MDEQHMPVRSAVGSWFRHQ